MAPTVRAQTTSCSRGVRLANISLRFQHQSLEKGFYAVVRKDSSAKWCVCVLQTNSVFVMNLRTNIIPEHVRWERQRSFRSCLNRVLLELGKSIPVQSALGCGVGERYSKVFRGLPQRAKYSVETLQNDSQLFPMLAAKQSPFCHSWGGHAGLGSVDTTQGAGCCWASPGLKVGRKRAKLCWKTTTLVLLLLLEKWL